MFGFRLPLNYKTFDLPTDVPLFYCPVPDFAEIYWDRKQLRTEAVQRRLLVVDIRGNSGGFGTYTLNLLVDLAHTFCSQKTIDALQTEYALFDSMRTMSEHTINDLFLMYGDDFVQNYLVQLYKGKDMQLGPHSKALQMIVADFKHALAHSN